MRLLRTPEIALGAVVARAVGVGTPTTIGSVLIGVATGPDRLVTLEQVGSDHDLYRDHIVSHDALTFYRVAKGTASQQRTISSSRHLHFWDV